MSKVTSVLEFKQSRLKKHKILFKNVRRKKKQSRYRLQLNVQGNAKTKIK
jgi:hypothetical protein